MMELSPKALEAALQRHYPLLSPEEAAGTAQRLLREIDQRLEPNVTEWVEGREISDLWVGKYCINAILSLRKDDDFLDALESMNLYLADEKAGVRRIWGRARR